MDKAGGAPAARRSFVLVAVVFVVVTVALGALLRLDLASGALSARGLSFPHLRHAHSHAGFYGALTMGWFLTTTAPPGRRLLVAHVTCAALATLLFALRGYTPSTIVLSTAVALFWFITAARNRPRRGDVPLFTDAAPFVLALSSALLPVIAVTARRDFALSRDLAHVFIGVLLACLFMPAAWRTLGCAPRSRAEVVVVTVVVALALGALVFAGRLEPPLRILGRLVVIGAAVVIGRVVARLPGPRPLRLAWWIVPLSFLAGVVPSLSTESVRVVGVHVWLLLVVLPTFSHAFAPRAVPVLVVVVHVALVAALSAGVLAGAAAVVAAIAVADAVVVSIAAVCVARAALAG